MGLAASQGRYLTLTARNSDLIYEAQQISQQRLTLATQTQSITDEYNAAMGNTIMVANLADGNSQRLTYDLITNQDPFEGLCMRIVDTNGNVVVPPNPSAIHVSYTNDEGEQVTETITSAADFADKYLKNDIQYEGMGNWSLQQLADYYNQNYFFAGNKVVYESGIDPKLKNENERYLFDENCKNPEYLQKMLTSGEWSLQKVSATSTDEWADLEWQGSTAVSEIYDTSDDAAAQAKYESAMAEIQKQDKILELRLEQVQTEQSAIEKEMESVKKVIDKNIDNSFKTFT